MTVVVTYRKNGFLYHKKVLFVGFDYVFGSSFNGSRVLQIHISLSFGLLSSLCFRVNPVMIDILFPVCLSLYLSFSIGCYRAESERIRFA